MSPLASVIKALGVDKVVWIDDMFSAAGQSPAPDITELATKIADGNLFDQVGHPEIAEEEDRIGALVALLAVDGELIGKAAALTGAETWVDRARKIMDSMQCVTEPKSGSEWQHLLEGDAPPYEKTLFLVDRDFKDEGIGSEQSDNLLKKTVSTFLVEAPSNYCVVVTK